MDNNNISYEEARAVTDYIKERLSQVYPQPTKLHFLKRSFWKKEMEKCDDFFMFNLQKRGFRALYGMIWQYFEMSDSVFLGQRGMRELAEHLRKTEEGTWIYTGWRNNVYVEEKIYSGVAAD